MKTFREFIIEAGATSTRLGIRTQEIINRSQNTPKVLSAPYTSSNPSPQELADRRRDFSNLKPGQTSLDILHRLFNYAKQRAQGIYPETAYSQRTRENPIRSRPTPPNAVMTSSGPLTRTYQPVRSIQNPLTPSARDERRASAGSSGQGSIPKGPKLYRQSVSGVSTGDDPFEVMKSAATQPKPLPKPRGTRRGSSLLSGGLIDIRPVDSPNDPLSGANIENSARRRAEQQFRSRGGVQGV